MQRLLRKFITGVNDKAITSRIPKVDVTALAAGTSTTAIYNHSKEPVAVSVGDTVIYQKFAGSEVKLDDEEYIVIKQDSILAIVEK